MVVVTGYFNEGSYPQSCRVPVSYIRRYITRLDLLLNPVSGIGNYYNSGLNIMSIWNTGIHAVPGNNVEIQFAGNTPAGQKYGKTGPICHSGIISTTGLNAYSGYPWGNLVRVDTHSQWPYSGIISQTGLNIIRGNLIDIQFDPASPAATIMHSKDGSWDNNFNKNSNLGNPYHSGIVSVTGLNATKGNLIDINFSADWPHSGTISTTGLNIIIGNGIGYTIDSSWPYTYEIFNTEKTKYLSSSINVVNNDTYPTSTTKKYALLTLSYNDFYFSKPNQTLSLLGTAVFKISNLSFGGRPFVSNSVLDTQKREELLPLIGTFTDTQLANFNSDIAYNYIMDSFTLSIGISGGNNPNLIENITKPITFKNSTPGDPPNNNTWPIYTSNGCIEKYRHNDNYPYSIYPYSINAEDPMTISAKVDLLINSANVNTLNSLALCAFITNVQCSRTYTYGEFLYTTQRCYAHTSATIEAKFIKAENIVP